MVNFFARACFALTSLAPALGAAAIIAVTEHESWVWGCVFGLSCLAAIFVSGMILLFVYLVVERSPLDVVEIEQADKHVLEFMLAYLLPIFSSTALKSMTGSMALTVYSLVIVAFTVVTGNIFQFNPVLMLFGYHFYVAKSADGISYLVISRQKYHKATRQLTCKAIGDYIRLDVSNNG